MKRVLPFLLILLLLLVIKNNISSIIASLNNTNTAQNLEEKLVTEKEKNRFLQERLVYVKTDKFIEEEAREKLGLLQPGEYFVIAPTPAPFGDNDFSLDDRPNWKKWADLLF